MFLLLFAPRHMEFLGQGQVPTTVATHTAAMAMSDPLTCCAQLGIKLASWCCRNSANSIWLPLVLILSPHQRLNVSESSLIKAQAD